ncbi:MAG: dockerin type I domain-containing protein, partial [Clostridiales bacterium]|nr:dockerin type I domain-containing protein [Clostridiales bacterium]
PLGGILRLSVFGEETGYINQDVEFTIAARNANDVLTVNVTFEIDGGLLAFKSIEGLNGFDMINGVSWRSMGGDVWRGTITLGYPDTGTETGAGFTNASYTDIGKLTFTPRAAGDVSVTLVKIDRVTGKAGLDVVDVDAIIENGVATTNIELVYSKYDLNRDGVVDALDLGMVLLYCGWDSDSPDWDTEIKVYDSHGKGVTAKMCDVNLDGVIDMLDLLDLFIHYTK